MKTCKTKKGQKARAAIRTVDDIADAQVLLDFCQAHKRKLITKHHEERNVKAWRALVPDGTYRLCLGFVRHYALAKHVHYRIQVKNGRKHKGAHLCPITIKNPSRRDWIWVTWQRCDDIELVPDGEVQDDDKVSDAAEDGEKINEALSRMRGSMKGYLQ